MLRRMGFDVPSPILTHYDWPQPPGQPPFEAQRITSAMLTMNPRGYVLNGLGTGKTRAALWAWDYLYQCGVAKKALVIAPLSTLKFTWAREVWATLPHRKCVVLHHSSRQKRLELANTEADIYIINHDGVKVLWETLEVNEEIDTLIIDELAVYRNGSAERTKTLRKLARAERMKFVWGMTGAPIPNAPTDAWAQCTIVTPHTVPKYFGHFRDKVMLKVSQFKYIPKADAVAHVYSVMQPSVRFTLDDVYELPETIIRTMDVELGKEQARVYKDLVQTCYAAVKSGEITAANAGAVMNKLVQVSIGWVYRSDGGVVPLDNTKRLEALEDAILDTDRKVLVFVPYKHALAGISAVLDKAGIEHAVVSGDTQPSIRADVFNGFQNTSKYKVLAAHPKCLAHGITLTAADTVIWFGPVTDLETYEQANARISRVGQKHKQLILHLQGTPVEKRIYAMLMGKRKVQDELLHLFEEATEDLDV